MAPRARPRPSTFDHLKSRKKATTRRVPICMDSELADKYAELSVEAELKKAEMRTYGGDDARREYEDLQAQADEAREKAKAETTVFVFRSLGRQRYDDLLAAHAPTPKQVEDAKKQGIDRQNFNVETFPIALIAACCVEPDLSEDEVKELWNSDEWNDAELSQLWEAALAVNSQRRVLDLGKD